MIPSTTHLETCVESLLQYGTCSLAITLQRMPFLRPPLSQVCPDMVKIARPVLLSDGACHDVHTEVCHCERTESSASPRQAD